MKRIPVGNIFPSISIDQNYKIQSFFQLGKIILLLLLAIVIVESAIIGYYYIFQGVMVPPNIRVKYNEAQKNQEGLKKQIEIYQLAATEDKKLVIVINQLALIKPPEIKLSSLQIGLVEEITLEGVGKDAIDFQKYVELINGDKKMFANAQLQRVRSEGDKGKGFTINAKLAN